MEYLKAKGVTGWSEQIKDKNLRKRWLRRLENLDIERSWYNVVHYELIDLKRAGRTEREAG